MMTLLTTSRTFWTAHSKNKFLAAGLAFFLMNLQAMATTLSDTQSTLSLTTDNEVIQARLSLPGMTDIAEGPYLWQATVDGAPQSALKQARIELLDKKTMRVTGKLGPLEVVQQFTLLDNARGFTEVISLRNPTAEEVIIDDIRTGFTRRVEPATDPYRLVAVPYRRQTDGSLHDYSMNDVVTVTQGKGRINPTSLPAWPVVATIVDEIHRRLRSESWILTDGKTGMLVMKYNNRDVEYSGVSWLADQQRLVFGGCTFMLFNEPMRANRIAAGESFQFGQTRYESYLGGWPEGYAIHKSFANAQGHGLTEKYKPQVQWNVLFDLGDQRWSRESALLQAELAKEVGCTRMYFDPGWQIPVSAHDARPLYGSGRWDEGRLGPMKDMVHLLKDSYGLELGLWTVARVAHDAQWPKEYYRQIPDFKQPVPIQRNGHRNLALLKDAKASASSVLEKGRYSEHQIDHLNDGYYGNNASWIAGAMPAWVEIDLGREYSISEVCLSNDHTQKFNDRGTKAFRILTATEYDKNTGAGTWHQVAEYQQYEAALTRKMGFSFAPKAARWVRIELLEPTTEMVRIDEIEIYESTAKTTAVAKKKEAVDTASVQTLNELCMSSEKWRAERLRRLSLLADAGLSFFMFDFMGWMGPCYSPDHGHAVPSSTLDHIESIYGTARAIRKKYPHIRIEMHDPVWPWSARYTPSYFHQGLTGEGAYDENWAYEFMWNTIDDIRSGRALSLYYHNLAYDIPMYLHFNMHADNDHSLAFWWLASTCRHFGFGGYSHAARKEPHGALKVLNQEERQRRLGNYKSAMATYNRLKSYFTHGEFLGIDGDEAIHLRVMPGKPGGVLMVFNLTTKPQTKTVRVPLAMLNLKAGKLPNAVGADVRLEGDDLVMELKMEPESPHLIEIGIPK